jgi:flavin-dependent dehydrogenase
MQHDILIIGGGLSGLLNAILLADAGLDVVLIEKKRYPFHRVCGEYVSNETLPLLRSIGFDPFDHGAVAIDRFGLTSPSGNRLEMPLDMGAFGISRYAFDHALAELAQARGARILQGEKALEFAQQADGFEVKTAHAGTLQGKVLIGAYGKRDKLDAFLQRKFFQRRSPWVGVKHHLRVEHPEDLIELHNFRDGYCGISRIENDRVCFCYLVARKQVRKFGNIERMERELLSENPHLKRILSTASFLYKRPEVINEISFSPKKLIERGMFMSGDTAGLIAPLCGNGMAMAMHAASLLSERLIRYFRGEMDREELEASYQQAWNQHFSRRLWVGRNVQRFFGNPHLTGGFVSLFKATPGLSRWVIQQTHGEEIEPFAS